MPFLANLFSHKIGLLGLALLLAGMYGGYSRIQSLNQEVAKQQEIIKNQQQANEALQTLLETERQAVEKQAEFTKSLKSNNEVQRETVKTILIKEPCAKAALPVDVRNTLKQLHR